ncbi:methylaspartate ammonia-lyase [Acrocarpospora pleiomorpha]|uniref:methylaspartate ammonia-lyase n=1 Tax=Acrocarpospora pleiomorpha TaxID=90975 RepID=A0A5M3Y4G4_9ACTN|nr:methylaspartate ammonia-lyase [Acrocarpospora pleiomorpha]GES27073.1 methylaspartate ammonia-lyase [Acrocarpospora pleiomorpha]
MSLKIERVVVVPGETAYYTDDQAAIRAGARQDGFIYLGEPRTPGFDAIRQPGESAAVLLVLSDGYIAHGDAAVVQYAGVAGRSAGFHANEIRIAIDAAEDRILSSEITDFRGATEWLDEQEAFPASVARAAAYGLSQALLDAAAHARGLLMAHVVQDFVGRSGPLEAVPTFTQSGDDRYSSVDRMILKRADFLPHGLFNDVASKFGADGQLFLDYVAWLRERVGKIGPGDYRPRFHLDLYGCAGDAFGRDTTKIADFLGRAAELAGPYRLRVEHPLDAGSHEGQIAEFAALRGELAARGIPVEIVADEWCNTLDEIRAFTAAAAADVIHVKTPDLGSIANAATALAEVRAAGFVGYCGGTCNETERSAQISAHVAMGAGADELLAKPGMGVDEALMIVRNEMARALALDGVLRRERGDRA